MRRWKAFAAAGAAAALAAAALWLARELALRRAGREEAAPARDAGPITRQRPEAAEAAETAPGPDERVTAREAALRFGDAAAPRRRVFYDQDADPSFPAPPGRSQETSAEAPPAPAQPEQGPVRNPVEAGPAAAPRRPDGTLDPTRIACAEDFTDWDGLGCRG